MRRRSTSPRCDSLPRSKRIAPKTRGVSVFTRPPRISGAPDHCAIEVTSTPLSARCFAVPPVERISTSFARSARARSTMPVLSETERIARSICMQFVQRPGAAAGCFPDEVIEVDRVGDGVGVTDRGYAERGRAIVERGSVSAAVLLGHQRSEARGAGEHPVEVAVEHKVRIEAVEDRRETGQAALEILLEVGTRSGIVVADVEGIVGVADEMR